MDWTDLITGIAALSFGFYAGLLERQSRRGAYRCPGCRHDRSFHTETGCNQRSIWHDGSVCACQTPRGELDELAFKHRRRSRDELERHVDSSSGIVCWNPLGGNLGD